MAALIIPRSTCILLSQGNHLKVNCILQNCCIFRIKHISVMWEKKKIDERGFPSNAKLSLALEYVSEYPLSYP